MIDKGARSYAYGKLFVRYQAGLAAGQGISEGNMKNAFFFQLRENYKLGKDTYAKSAFYGLRGKLDSCELDVRLEIYTVGAEIVIEISGRG